MSDDTPPHLQTQTLKAALHIDSLVTYYEQELARLHHQPDPLQRKAVEALNELRQRLLAAQAPKTLLQKWFALRNDNRELERGLYFWGGVGRGKTWLMDLFYHSLPFKQKQRSHFHRFMQFIHDELKKHRDRADPLDLIAEHLANRTRVLCFDELFVSDIADAMLLGNLFRSLFDRGVTLVATSNCAPDELYRDGLQRVRFLPAIQLIKENTQIFNLDSGIDYRLRHLEHVHTWFDQQDAATQTQMMELFSQLNDGTTEPGHTLHINHRRIKVRHQGPNAVWFEFHDLCDGPRGPADYVEIARCYTAVFVSGMPELAAPQENQARRFINMVDEFYDRGVKLFIAAAATPAEVYQGSTLKFEFQRTQSRLTEMQSRAYLSQPHKP